MLASLLLVGRPSPSGRLVIRLSESSLKQESINISDWHKRTQSRSIVS
jgi:hypothetical protein